MILYLSKYTFHPFPENNNFYLKSFLNKNEKKSGNYLVCTSRVEQKHSVLQ